MLDKLKKFRDSFSERTKMLIYVGAAILVFILSCFLPLAFRSSAAAEPGFGNGARASMFVKYINNDSSIRFKVDDEPDNGELKRCEAIFDELSSYCIIDKVSRKTVTEGCQFINLSDGENQMRICRMWFQDQGDWTNWMDVYMDADTGFVYYLYINSTCVSNGRDYSSAIEEGELSVKTLASSIAKETGYDLKVLNWTGKTEDAASIYTVLNGDALIWNISSIYYPSSYLDIKITVG